MSIPGAVIVPHPPVILPQVGKGREREVQPTIDAYRLAAKQIADWKPEVIIISSPHTIMYTDYFHISPGKKAHGDMSAFGAPSLRIKAEYDNALRSEIIRQAVTDDMPVGILGEEEAKLDHGVMIPLYFVQEAGVNCPIVRMGLSGLSPAEHYRLGMHVAQAVKTLNRRAVFIASGDLSHKLKDDGPYGFIPEGPVFDKLVTDAMSTGNFLDFLTLDASLADKAAECGLRSFQIMAGVLDGLDILPRLCCYQGSFGVGYAVAVFTVTGEKEDRKLLPKYEKVRQEQLAAKRLGEDPWVQLARRCLEHYIRTGKQPEALPENLPDEMTEQASGAFVSLHLYGNLRGCIGTITPVTPSVAEEICRNAVLAATEDPRFPPVQENELDDLDVKVDVLGPAEPINSPTELDPKRYGVIVSSGRRRGLLLPDLDGVDTVEQQIDIARQKAGIKPSEPYTLQRFEVVRHT